MIFHDERPTYNQLRELIGMMTPEQRDCHVTVNCQDTDEFLPVVQVTEVDDSDEDDAGSGILDNTHPYLVIGF